jgi:group I intron endonuclease
MNSGVYEVFVVSTGDRYIGSSVNLRKRMREHRSDLKYGRHKYKAIQAAYDLDPDDVVINVLEHCIKPLVRHREQHYIDTTACINMYDYALVTPISHSAKTRAKMSASATGKIRSKQHCQRISAAKKGKKGKKHTAEEKAKISASMKGVHTKPIYVRYQDGTEMTFATGGAAAKHIGVGSNLVLHWTKGKSTTYLKRGIAEIKYA